MIIIGIDPGASGGIADIFTNAPPIEVSAEKLPKTEADTFKLIRQVSGDFKVLGWDLTCYIEKVHSMPGQGVSSTFKFGMNYGFLRGCLVSLGIPFVDVTPQKWQRAVGIHKIKDETNTAKKNRHKQLAQQLFPQLAKKITHATADALLIAEYGRRLKAGEL
jgi:crossover junction endodeoxyribonuclease RuvC